MWTDNTRNAKIKGDQIEVFKILNGYENIDSNLFFEIKESKITRGHNFTLVKKQSKDQTQGVNRQIPCRGLHTSLNHSSVSPKMGCLEYT